MRLIIVESPTKAKTLSRFLGKDYSIEATMGHVKDLPKSQLGIDVKANFKPDYVFIEKRAEAIGKIKKLAKSASKIYLATDPDREGEAISYHVKEMLGDGKTSRIVFHEITKEAVEEAIEKPRAIDKNLVDAQIGRRVLDRLVGYKLSPLLWKKVRRGLSAGRVQTVAVRLIVEREKEIEKFKPEEFWSIFCEVKSKGKKDKAFLIGFVGKADSKIGVKNAKDAASIVAHLKKSSYEVLEVRKREVRKNPYPPFTTSTMSQAGARIFGWSVKRTMSIAQRLYERGLITYHRTDSAYVSAGALAKVRELIGADFGKEYLPPAPRFYKVTSKVAQEAHEAIRPTDLSKKSDDIKSKKYGGDARLLYDLIYRRFVASQMTASLYDETIIDVAARRAGDETTYLLRASGQVIKFDGWRAVIPAKKDAEAVSVLPAVEKGEALSLIKVNSQQKFTEPPARFNEASLIKTLEQLGIGRPSTYAPIITTIQIRNYVEKEEGKFTPTPVGVAVNGFLMEHFPDVFDYQFTAEMESDLDKVADGKNKWEESIKKFWKPFEKKLASTERVSKRVKIEVEKMGLACPKCKKGELVVRIGRFGKFVSCSRFPDCDFTEKYIEKIGMKCPKCKKGEIIVKKTGRGKKFYGCSRYPKCDFASWKNPKIKEKEEQ
ncbi:MAG: topoisomerase protein [Candidatus Woesebacteria bacterium GW2011_GWC2_47_16]|uniref:DNA topoisomerase 1 n=9 Tax=Candidatus Woeseibacteriota TaxID=1752722 RepID=A0A0G1QT34_9BACT|nr:MAG: topoisomerase protein [Candidatus Woesebacteria bacterium GW2011_GWE1_45_18]KKU25262.1 MAG: topoisomerase protein [Candidatus Woesebacteria bacterium GW2011_GWF1_46_13]KKU48067.1 MAG: topoisomerase protein [Candidatus Woesebacteria bacterium GW2011_GWF2_46_8]KKU65245.1 MAG: topoisomerase protein [Candidatus Woesebacteria bacterium GW2011_GWC2_47_16]KKU71069.1 MAG: topoisomerase protein [Candidatus Woesebacteria bacterium GW2011_GWD1_47_21]OGM77989.1 MAG: DNA topoisomerase I [Candidatus